MRYAAIDVGTNSCRLLIADVQTDRLTPCYRQLITTRIGEGVGASRQLKEAAIHRTLMGLKEFFQVIKNWGVDGYQVVATSAVRGAENRSQFTSRAWKDLGIKVEVISGEEEAGFSYLGVKKGLALKNSPLVVDLGGGSTEFMLEGEAKCSLSLPIGAVRAAEKNMSPEDIGKIVYSLAINRQQVLKHPLVVVGGTVTTLVAIKMGLLEYCSDKVHGQTLTRLEVSDLQARLAGMTLPERMQVPGLQPERADIIPWGALILLKIMDFLERQELIASESDILEGLIWSMYRSDYEKHV
ncbi:Ppx/GppA phosphatase family protein [Syntrophomonas erecta]